MLAAEHKQWPVDLMGGRRGAMPELRDAILNAELSRQELAEPLQGDDCPIEYDEKGYPELPDCL